MVEYNRQERRALRARVKSLLKSSLRYSLDTYLVLFDYLELIKSGADGHEREDDTIMPEVFFSEYDSKLKDPELFWKLFRYVLIRSNITKFEKQIRKSLERYDRLSSTTLFQRQEMSIYPKEVNDEADNELEMKLLCELKAHTEPFEVYRGFFARENADIREDRKYSNKRQIEGAGLSYSVNRHMAIWFAFHSILHHGRYDYERPTRQKRENLNEFQILCEEYYKKGTPVVGIFEIHPEDVILAPLQDRSEGEIIAFPENAILKNYQLLSSEQFYEACDRCGMVTCDTEEASTEV